MIKWKLFIFPCLIILFCFTWANAKTITLLHNDVTSFPYIIVDTNEEAQNPKRPGSIIEFLNLVGKELGVKIKFESMPWANGLEKIKTNVADGIFQSSYSAQRVEIGRFPMKAGKVDRSRRIQTMSYFFYTTKDSTIKWDGEKIYNLGDRSIGTIIGYAIINDLVRIGVPYEVNASTYGDFKKVLNRSEYIAATANIESIADFILRKNPDVFQDIVKLQPPLKEKDYYLLLSREFVSREPLLAEAIWDKIRELREAGILIKLMEKYTD